MENDKIQKHGTPVSYKNGCRCEVCKTSIVAYQSERRRIRLRDGVPDHVHGSINGYRNYQCRCDPCVEAGNVYRQRYTKVKTTREYDKKYPGEPHGEELAYKRGCRCKPCTLAHQLYSREYREMLAKKYLDPKYDGRHGFDWMFRKGCRCEPCKSASGAAWRLKKYGLSPEQFEKLLNDQGGACAVCREGLQTTRATHVDHDHGTGNVRGILCEHCNRGLGAFRDNPEWLIAAAEYLKSPCILE